MRIFLISVFLVLGFSGCTTKKESKIVISNLSICNQIDPATNHCKPSLYYQVKDFDLVSVPQNQNIYVSLEGYTDGPPLSIELQKMDGSRIFKSPDQGNFEKTIAYKIPSTVDLPLERYKLVLNSDLPIKGENRKEFEIGPSAAIEKVVVCHKLGEDETQCKKDHRELSPGTKSIYVTLFFKETKPQLQMGLGILSAFLDLTTDDRKYLGKSELFYVDEMVFTREIALDLKSCTNEHFDLEGIYSVDEREFVQTLAILNCRSEKAKSP